MVYFSETVSTRLEQKLHKQLASMQEKKN